jgi:PEP-CTERM motif-containing protein
MKTVVVSCLTVLALSVAPRAVADPVSADGRWLAFLFASAGTFATECGHLCGTTVDPIAEDTSAPPWTFSGAADVTLTDLFARGDRFALFDNSVLVGDTSVPVNDAAVTCPTAGVGNDILACLANPTYSHGTFALGAGSHSLTIEVIQNAAGTTGGAAVFQVSAVPEPSTFIPLFGLGLLGLAGLRRRMR